MQAVEVALIRRPQVTVGRRGGGGTKRVARVVLLDPLAARVDPRQVQPGARVAAVHDSCQTHSCQMQSQAKKLRL